MHKRRQKKKMKCDGPQCANEIGVSFEMKRHHRHTHTHTQNYSNYLNDHFGELERTLTLNAIVKLCEFA